MVDVVQSVEHRIVVPSVVGSSPIIHPSQPSDSFGGFFCPTKARSTSTEKALAVSVGGEKAGTSTHRADLVSVSEMGNYR